MKSPKYPTAKAIEKLSNLLKLGRYGQDWEIELADSSRVEEFCDIYPNVFSPYVENFTQKLQKKT